MLKVALAVIAFLAPAISNAAAQAGNVAAPIPVKMKRGTDRITFKGVLRQNHDCCSYVFKAKAGQTLYWNISGPAYRVTIAYPNGDVDGPGVPNRLPLPQNGAYVFSVSPNLMAEGAFGRFVLKMRIPPLAQ